MNEFVALSGGEPLSITTTVIVLVLGPCASVGVQVIAPEAVLMLMPEGGASRLKLRAFVGTSESVADAETFRLVSSSSVWLEGTFNRGGELTSLTVTEKELVAESGG